MSSGFSLRARLGTPCAGHSAEDDPGRASSCRLGVCGEPDGSQGDTLTKSVQVTELWESAGAGEQGKGCRSRGPGRWPQRCLLRKAQLQEGAPRTGGSGQGVGVS